VAISCEHGDKPSGSVGGEKFDQLRHYQLLEKACVSWRWIFAVSIVHNAARCLMSQGTRILQWVPETWRDTSTYFIFEKDFCLST
jgi:hypothetical protein